MKFLACFLVYLHFNTGVEQRKEGMQEALEFLLANI